MDDPGNRPAGAARPFQFSLRAMLYFLAAVSVCLAGGVWFGPCGLVLFALAAVGIVWIARSSLYGEEKTLLGMILAGCLALLLWHIPAEKRPELRSRCANRLRHIGFALQEYHDAYGSFPPAYLADAGGKPMHSWRVLILPYLENRRLYAQYNFNEPWDGPNNRLLANQISDVFRCPSDNPAKPDETSYVAVVGPRTIWPGAESTVFGDIPDGATKTVLVVEVENSGIHWMEPRDLDISALKPAARPGRKNPIASGHPGGPQAVMADASLRTLSKSMRRDTLEAFFTRDGGEPIDE
ncbi:MAG: DUF1559 domain-containing protein [Pirellulales bacterium]